MSRQDTTPNKSWVSHVPNWMGIKWVQIVKTSQNGKVLTLFPSSSNLLINLTPFFLIWTFLNNNLFSSLFYVMLHFDGWKYLTSFRSKTFVTQLVWSLGSMIRRSDGSERGNRLVALLKPSSGDFSLFSTNHLPRWLRVIQEVGSRGRPMKKQTWPFLVTRDAFIPRENRRNLSTGVCECVRVHVCVVRKKEREQTGVQPPQFKQRELGIIVSCVDAHTHMQTRIHQRTVCALVAKCTLKLHIYDQEKQAWVTYDAGSKMSGNCTMKHYISLAKQLPTEAQMPPIFISIFLFIYFFLHSLFFASTKSEIRWDKWKQKTTKNIFISASSCKRNLFILFYSAVFQSEPRLRSIF